MDVRKTELFTTLLASKPASTRSPAAVALAVVLHAVLLILLIVVTRPFVPSLANKLFEQITIVVPEEAVPTITLLPTAPAPAVPAPSPRPSADNRPFDAARPPELVVGPITPGIPEPTPGPETVEPSDDGRTSGSLADRLRPSTLDPRLSGSATYALPGDASPAAGVRSRIAQSIDAYNDSVALELEARRRGLDWTIKTKDGKQWGIGPDGKIHLGDITLPPLVAFTPAPGRRDEVNARNRDYAEIERQANSEIGRQSFNQRVKAIRARRDKERAEKKKAAETAAPISEGN